MRKVVLLDAAFWKILFPTGLPFSLDLSHSLVEFSSFVLREPSPEAAVLDSLQAEVLAGFRYPSPGAIILDVINHKRMEFHRVEVDTWLPVEAKWLIFAFIPKEAHERSC